MSLQLQPYTGHQYIAQGLSSFGASMGEAIKTRRENSQQEAMVTGQLDQYLNSGLVNPETLSPEGKKAFEKFAQGKATMQDKMALSGMFQTSMALQKQKADQDRQLMERQMAEQNLRLDRLKEQSLAEVATQTQKNRITLEQIAARDPKSQGSSGLYSIASNGLNDMAAYDTKSIAGQSPLSNNRNAQIAKFASDPMIKQMADMSAAGLDVNPTAFMQMYGSMSNAKLKAEAAGTKGAKPLSLNTVEGKVAYAEEIARRRASPSPVDRAIADQLERMAITPNMLDFAGTNPPPTPTPTDGVIEYKKGMALEVGKKYKMPDGSIKLYQGTKK